MIKFFYYTGIVFTSFNAKMYYTCDYCSKISIRNYYIFKIIGLGKHDGKIICKKCLEKKFEKKIN